MVAHKGQWLRVGTWALWPGPLSLNTTYNHTQAALCGAAFPLSPVLCVGVLEKMKSSCRWRFNCSAGQPLIIGKGNSEIRACPEDSFSAGACWGSLQAKPRVDQQGTLWMGFVLGEAKRDSSGPWVLVPSMERLEVLSNCFNSGRTGDVSALNYILVFSPCRKLQPFLERKIGVR